VMELVNAALSCTRELGMFVYLAPFLRQAKAIAWQRLKQRLESLRMVGAVEFHEGDLAVVFRHNSATIRLFGADNYDALRGLRLDGVVVDEPGWVAPAAWNDVVQPALSDRKGWALFIGTPNGIDLFSELFQRAQQTPGWVALRFTVEETEALEAAEVKRLRR